MKTILIIQARMNSRRLPGKVLRELKGLPVLEHIVNRLKCCKNIDELVVATSCEESDDVLRQFCIDKNIKVFCGDLNDVLDRFYKLAKFYDAEWIVRITGDCPMIDPDVVDEVIVNAKSGEYDWYSLGGDFPDGLDTQVFTFETLEKAWSKATKSYEREHVGPYVEMTNPDSFKIGILDKFEGLSNIRLTLDEYCDLEFLEAILSKIEMDIKDYRINDILNIIKLNPHLLKINSEIIRNEGLKKSIEASV